MNGMVEGKDLLITLCPGSEDGLGSSHSAFLSLQHEYLGARMYQLLLPGCQGLCYSQGRLQKGT